MNICIQMGRLARDPEIRTTQSGMKIAGFTLAVERRFKKEGQPDADFLNFTAFGKTAEFIEKYCHKGTKLVVQSQLQNNNYTKQDGTKVYRDTLMVDSAEFAESKAVSQQNTSANKTPAKKDSNDFMAIPNGIEEEMPFN